MGYGLLATGGLLPSAAGPRSSPQLHLDILGKSYEGELEIRQLADLGPEQR